MSNPTTHVEPFDGSLGDFTGVAPIRYSNGLWLEEATTNAYINPVAGNGTSTLAPLSNRANAVVSVPTPLPGHLSGVTDCFRVTSAGDFGAGTTWASLNIGNLSAALYQLSVYVYIPAATSISAIGFTAGNFTSGVIVAAIGDAALTNQWQRIGPATLTPDVGDLAGILNLTVTGLSNGEVLYFIIPQVERKDYMTSATAGSLGAGYAFTGTAHNSTSTRAASSAAISPSGILSPDTGSLAFRFTRKIDTGGTETILECGTAGSGTDYLSVAVNASDKLVVSWNSDNAGAQTVTSTDSIAVDTEYFVYTDWDSTDINLRVDAATDTDTRDAVQDDFGAGDLTLEASAGGAIFNGFATYDRPLTDYEQSRLYAQPVWGLQTLVRSNKFNTFQLRPIGA